MLEGTLTVNHRTELTSWSLPAVLWAVTTMVDETTCHSTSYLLQEQPGRADTALTKKRQLDWVARINKSGGSKNIFKSLL